MDSFSAELSLLSFLKRGPEGAQSSPASSWLDSHSDIQLIELFKNGSPESMGVLYQRYKGLVLSVSQKILHDRNEAEDIVQDVFLEIYKRIELFDTTRGSVRIWILQYAYSRSLNRRRYLSLRSTRDCASEDGPSPLELERDDAPNALDQSILEEHARMIQKALQEISSKQRHVIYLAYFQGLSMREIAAQTEDTLVNVRTHYYRGLKKLRHVLAKVLAEGRKPSHVAPQK